MAADRLVRIEFTSAFEMLDFVQVVNDHVGRSIGLDEDSVHWVGVAVRECVINAIKHGNLSDTAKHVFVEFKTAVRDEVAEVAIRVRDQGQGFDPENLLKASGRGIFLIRNFMDDVRLQRAAEGGMEVRMVKRAP